MNEFLLGMIVMACLVAGLFFLRFWRKTRDRLFAVFALAFWLLALNWCLLAISHQVEVQNSLYVIRLCAFVLILAGIADKNRANRSGMTP
jgi:Ca2+/Na+ antiporter